MRRRKRASRIDWRGLSVALVFIALMYADFFLFRGRLSGIVVGGAFASLGLVLVVRNVRMIQEGLLVPAMVVDHDVERSDDEMYYTPIVEFTERGGRTQRRRTDTGFGVKRPRVGARVLVRYDPTGKIECQILGAARWIIPCLLIAVGVLVWVLAATKQAG